MKFCKNWPHWLKGGVAGIIFIIILYIYLLFTPWLPNCPRCLSHRGFDAFVFNIGRLTFEEVLIFIGIVIIFFGTGSILGWFYGKVKSKINNKK
jgi:hypothetical protein